MIGDLSLTTVCTPSGEPLEYDMRFVERIRSCTGITAEATHTHPVDEVGRDCHGGSQRGMGDQARLQSVCEI